MRSAKPKVKTPKKRFITVPSEKRVVSEWQDIEASILYVGNGEYVISVSGWSFGNGLYRLAKEA